MTFLQVSQALVTVGFSMINISSQDEIKQYISDLQVQTYLDIYPFVRLILSMPARLHSKPSL